MEPRACPLECPLPDHHRQNGGRASIFAAIHFMRKRSACSSREFINTCAVHYFHLEAIRITFVRLNMHEIGTW